MLNTQNKIDSTTHNLFEWIKIPLTHNIQSACVALLISGSPLIYLLLDCLNPRVKCSVRPTAITLKLKYPPYPCARGLNGFH